MSKKDKQLKTSRTFKAKLILTILLLMGQGILAIGFGFLYIFGGYSQYSNGDKTLLNLIVASPTVLIVVVWTKGLFSNNKKAVDEKSNTGS